ncbi:hypothetical protein [Portibacter lacus]|uniref:hypothetical protein n=1 Tax=Portibacter lacus TaxID=1099794 RepID=UPI001F29873A|nr:hypothetical protein [Portibacter lacus]
MKRIIDTPHLVIFLAIPLIFGLSFIGYNTVIDLQYHDTYIVVGMFQLGITFCILLGFIGLIYWLLRKIRLIAWMTQVHVLITILTIASMVVSGALADTLYGEKFNPISLIMFNLTNLLLLSQFIFVINIIKSLIRKKREIQ